MRKKLFLLLFLHTTLLAGSGTSGTWRLIKDSDGKTPKKGAVITLTFSGSQVSLKAVMPGTTVTDSGSVSEKDSTITIRFNQMSFGCRNARFTISGNRLTLPFKILSTGNGNSVWKKQSALSGFSSGDSGDDGNKPSGNGNGQSGSGSGDRTGQGNSGKGKPGSNSPDPSDPTKGTEKADARQCPFSNLVGQWGGKAAGAEVRFRRRGGFRGGPQFNIMTLTTKHGCEFFFYVFKDGSIKGEGIILYNLDVNLSGVDALAGAVKGLMGMMPFPSISGLPATSGLAKGIMEAKGVTGTSYSYKMVGAPQQRRFMIKGRVYRSGNEWKIRLESNGDFLAGKKTDNKLYVEYEVNLVRTRKSFPTWSPFLKDAKEDATVRTAAGGKVFMAESVSSGKQRGGVRIWHEYTFSWYARKIR